MEQKDLIKRLSDYIEYDALTKPTTFAKGAGIDPSGFSKMLKGQQTITVDTLKKIAHAYNINLKWLMDGVGEVYARESVTEQEQNNETRPRIPMAVVAGLLTGFSDSIKSSDCEQMPIIKAFPPYDCTMIVKGDSMEPKFEGGDEIAIRKVCDVIEWGKTYVLDTRDGAILKRLYDNGDNFKCVSFNPEYRDLFMLTFYLIGINTVDLADCTLDSIVNGRLEYRRHKTNKLYSIKIEPEAMEIINRYKGTKHLIRCFDRYKDYKALQGSVNNALAKIGPARLDDNGNFIFTGNNRKEMQPLEKGLSLYWARYSWATYAADLDIPKDTISEALGHSHGAKVTGVYIKYNRDKVDAANRKVIDYVLGKANRPG